MENGSSSGSLGPDFWRFLLSFSKRQQETGKSSRSSLTSSRGKRLEVLVARIGGRVRSDRPISRLAQPSPSLGLKLEHGVISWSRVLKDTDAFNTIAQVSVLADRPDGRSWPLGPGPIGLEGRSDQNCPEIWAVSADMA